MTEYGGYLHSMILVSLYDTLGPEAVTFIVNHAQLSVVVCTEEKIPKVYFILFE
jgi:long-chain acyl-CoA synthetase